MINIFKDKKILLFLNTTGLSLFQGCIDEMKRQGASVKIILRDIHHPTDLKSAGFSIFHIANKLINVCNEYKLHRRYVEEKGDTKYDYFITIGYYQVSSKFIKSVKKNHPNCKTIVYFYDSFCRLDFSNDIKLFDLCFTFDREDAENYKINYLPYFVSSITRDNILNYKYDLCHIGVYSAGHLYRVPVLEQLKQQALENNLTCYFKCYSAELNMNALPVKRQISLFFRQLFIKEYRLYFKYLNQYKDSDIFMKERIMLEQIAEIEKNSKCIIDINAPRAGISPRIIQALANQKKVIINTDSIKGDFFYSPNNVNIINDNNPVLDINFLEKNICQLNMKELLIPHWLLFLIGENKSINYL